MKMHLWIQLHIQTQPMLPTTAVYMMAILSSDKTASVQCASVFVNEIVNARHQASTVLLYIPN